jgi:hypothetical protein
VIGLPDFNIEKDEISAKKKEGEILKKDFEALMKEQYALMKEVGTLMKNIQSMRIEELENGSNYLVDKLYDFIEADIKVKKNFLQRLKMIKE